MNIGDKIQCVFASKDCPSTLVDATIICVIDENEKYYRVKAYFIDHIEYRTVKIIDDGRVIFVNW